MGGLWIRRMVTLAAIVAALTTSNYVNTAVVAASAAEGKKKPIICFRNVARNPRTASLFEKGTLNQYGNPKFQYMMAEQAGIKGLECAHTVLLIQHNYMNNRVGTRRWLSVFVGCRRGIVSHGYGELAARKSWSRSKRPEVGSPDVLITMCFFAVSWRWCQTTTLQEAEATQAMVDRCTKKTPCIITGDEVSNGSLLCCYESPANCYMFFFVSFFVFVFLPPLFCMYSWCQVHKLRVASNHGGVGLIVLLLS